MSCFILIIPLIDKEEEGGCTLGDVLVCFIGVEQVPLHKFRDLIATLTFIHDSILLIASISNWNIVYNHNRGGKNKNNGLQESTWLSIASESF